jgi:hypothetical protein
LPNRPESTRRLPLLPLIADYREQERMTGKSDTVKAGNACLTSDTGYTNYATTDPSTLSLPNPEKQSPPSSSSDTIPAHNPHDIEAAHNDTTTNNTPTKPHPPYGTTTNPNLSEKDLPPFDDADLPTAAALTLHPSAATTIDFPEGGLTGWLVVLGSFCAMLSLFGLINSAAVFESYFSTHQLAHKTSSEIGWIFSLYLFIVFFVGIQVGPFFDRFGARVPIAVGGALIFLSLLLLSWCDGTSFCLVYFPHLFCLLFSLRSFPPNWVIIPIVEG